MSKRVFPLLKFFGQVSEEQVLTLPKCLKVVCEATCYWTFVVGVFKLLIQCQYWQLVYYFLFHPGSVFRDFLLTFYEFVHFF